MKKMKRICWLLIIVFLLSAIMPGAGFPENQAMAADTLRVAKITAVQGDVKVLRAGGEKSFSAFKGMGLTQGDTIITGKDGRVTLELAEDKELKIGENSRVMISELLKSLEDNADKISLNLKAGQVYTNVKNKLSSGAKYEIRTPTAVMGVRGTQFFVTLSSGGQAKVVTLEGNVIVTVPQVVTLEDGTTTTQEVEIEVQPNQIFVQTGDPTDPGSYDLDTLTGDEELSLFVLETLQEISEQQPDLINPEILQNLEERIEKARQEQQEQQRQQERQQEELGPNIQYDSNIGNEGPPIVDPGNYYDDPGNGNDEPDDDRPEVVILTPLNDLVLHAGEARSWLLETVPDEDVGLEAVAEDWNIVEPNIDGNYLYIFALEPGSTTVTVYAYKDGYLPAEVSFNVTVYGYDEESDWESRVIDEYYGLITHTDIALDSKGMPHIIYDTYEMKYRHWNGCFWQEEERNASGMQGSLIIIPDSGGYDCSLVSYNYYGILEYDVFDSNWHYLGFESGTSVRASSTNATLYYNDDLNEDIYGAGISYYDEESGDLYFRFNPYPINNNYGEWTTPFRVDGASSNAGKSSSLAFTCDSWSNTVTAFIAYHDSSDGGSLKLAQIQIIDPLDPQPENLYISKIDDNLGYGAEGQYVSLAVDPLSRRLHLAYYDANNKKLKYAVSSGEEWLIETVDDRADDVGRYASLVLDDEGNPHISYYAGDEAGGMLKYARRDPDYEDYWLIEVVDQGEEVGLYSSIAWDDNLSVPHFAYIARFGEYYAVKHVTRQGVMNSIEPNFLFGTVEQFGDEAFYISSLGNDVLKVEADVYIEEEYSRELIDLEKDVDYYLSEENEGLIFTLTSEFLNSLGVNSYVGPHRIWIRFGYGLPVLITVEVTEDYATRKNPDVAYDRVNNRYLMVYERGIVEYLYSEIWGRFISADGILGPEFRISEDERCLAPKVAYNPVNKTFLVTWAYESYDEGLLIYAQILNNEGEPYGNKGNFAVCPETVNGQYYPAVTANTSTGDYLIAWEEQVDESNLKREIYGQLLDKEGNRISERLVLVSMPDYQESQVLAYSSAGNQYLLVFRDTTDYICSDIKGILFDSAGEPVSEAVLPIAVGEAEQYAHALAVDANGRFLVLWEEYLADEGVYNIFGRFINYDGTLAGDAFRVYQSENNQYAPSAVFNTDGYFLVAWHDGLNKLYARYFTAEGSGLGEAVPIGPQEEEIGNVKVVYNSEENNYLAIYTKYGGSGRIGVVIIDIVSPVKL